MSTAEFDDLARRVSALEQKMIVALDQTKSLTAGIFCNRPLAEYRYQNIARAQGGVLMIGDIPVSVHGRDPKFMARAINDEMTRIMTAHEAEDPAPLAHDEHVFIVGDRVQAVKAVEIVGYLKKVEIGTPGVVTRKDESGLYCVAFGGLHLFVRSDQIALTGRRDTMALPDTRVEP
jgi:hypothetical protein